MIVLQKVNNEQFKIEFPNTYEFSSIIFTENTSYGLRFAFELTLTDFYFSYKDYPLVATGNFIYIVEPQSLKVRPHSCSLLKIEGLPDNLSINDVRYQFLEHFIQSDIPEYLINVKKVESH